MRDGTVAGTKGMNGGSAMGNRVHGTARRQQAGEAARARGGAGALAAILEGGADESASDDGSLASGGGQGATAPATNGTSPSCSGLSVILGVWLHIGTVGFRLWRCFKTPARTADAQV